MPNDQGRRSRAVRPETVAVALALIGLLAASAVAGQGAGQGGILDNAQSTYRSTAHAWLGPMSAIARRLFIALAGLEISVSGLLWTLRRDSMDEIAGRFLIKFILLSFVLLLITGASYWLPPIVNSLAYAGEVAGIAPVAAGPSEVVDLGVYIAFSKIDTTGLPLSTSSLLTAVFAIVARLVILGAFLWVAALLVLAWVESYVAIAGGVLFLGFGGFRATAQYAENYLNYLVFLGVRLFLFYLLLGAGMTIFVTAITGMTPTATPQEMAELVAMAVIFAALILRIPGNTADRVAGSASFGLAAALRSL